MPHQAAKRHKESQDFRAKHDGRHAADCAGTEPDDKSDHQGKYQPGEPCGEIYRHFAKRVVNHRAACRNVGVGQDIQHKSDREAIDQIPTFTQQIFSDGIKA